MHCVCVLSKHRVTAVYLTRDNNCGLHALMIICGRSHALVELSCARDTRTYGRAGWPAPDALTTGNILTAGTQLSEALLMLEVKLQRHSSG